MGSLLGCDRWRCLFQGIPLAALLGAAPLAISCERNKADLQPGDRIESVGREVAVRFPPSTRLIGVHREKGIDEWIGVKVEMSSGDWPGFLASTPIDPGLFEPGSCGKLGSDFAFWDPHKAKKLRTAQAILQNGRVLNIAYDDSRGSVVVVYVVNHSR